MNSWRDRLLGTLERNITKKGRGKWGRNCWKEKWNKFCFSVGRNNSILITDGKDPVERKKLMKQER